MVEKHNCMDYFEIGGGCSICNNPTTNANEGLLKEIDDAVENLLNRYNKQEVVAFAGAIESEAKLYADLFNKCKAALKTNGG